MAIEILRKGRSQNVLVSFAPNVIVPGNVLNTLIMQINNLV